MLGTSVGTESVIGEFQGADLGDERLASRMRLIVSRVAKAPDLSFPRVTAGAVELEGLYRWFGNERFDAQEVLAPHIEQTTRRAAERGLARVVHDTTDFAFKGERKELGIIEGKVFGFFAHVALAIGPDELREPLGVLGLKTYIQSPSEVKARRGKSPSKLTALARATPREAKTSHRWEALALEVEERLPTGLQAIHVMDQDADDYVVLATLTQKGKRFVIRGSAGRLLKPKGKNIDEMLESRPTRLFRRVRLEHRRKTKVGARYQRRDERDAQLHVRWAPLTLRRPDHAQSEIRELNLSVLQVLEPDPPQGEQAVDWTLLTSEPIETLEQAAEVIDHYRARWMIEEYFKALKTGCAVEKRQLTTYNSLCKVVALFMPIAWEMLRLRYLARQKPQMSATHCFSSQDLQILKTLLKEYKPDFVLSHNPTVREVLWGIARLGGHLKRNGEPGWITIGRGFQDLARARDVWRLARRCDQS